MKNQNEGKRYCLAIDIGASSGRHIVGWYEAGELLTKEVFRFKNGVSEQNGHLVWDIGELLTNVKEGIERAIAFSENDGSLESLSIDTWGVDYVLLKGESEITPCFAYRDNRTEEAVKEVHRIIPFEELYAHTGTQFQPFNSIYQLYADKNSGRLEQATDMLMIPEYLLWKLCGKKVREYTNATTTGLINARTGQFDKDLIARLGFDGRLFGVLKKPGTVIGEYKGIKCILCATHDTASAVEGIPMDEGFNELGPQKEKSSLGMGIYISSGTWSLLGVKTKKPLTDTASMNANFSNEGGVGYNRYQKNIMGMWVINRLRDELCPKKSFAEIVKEASSSKVTEVVDVNAEAFLAPESMKKAFDDALGHEMDECGAYFRCAYLSLASCYAKTIRELEANTGLSYSRLYIVGGGAKNDFLNGLTAKATGKIVIALPIEATALGNLKLQLRMETK